MNRVVKKIVVCVAVLLTVGVSAAHAQKGAMAGGVNFAIAFGAHDFFYTGLAPKFQYYLSNHFRGEVDLTIFLPKNSKTCIDLAAYVHYLFEINEKASVYPIAGVGFFSEATTNKGGISSWPAAAFGGGIEYALSGRISVNGEFKYKLVSVAGSFGMLTAGLAYKF